MNENEDYYRITKKGDIHILSDRTPLKLKEILILPTSTFLLFLPINWIVGIVVSILWFYFSEIHINEKTREIIHYKKLLNKTKSVNTISKKFNSSFFKFSALNRSGKTKFLMSYVTHKDHDLLILKNELDKNIVLKYIGQQIK